MAGNPFTASLAVPAKTSISSSSPSRLMPFSTRWGAPSRPMGGLRDTMVTWSTRPAQADFIPSKPAMAPEGASNRQPFSRDSSMMPGLSSRAPMLMTIRSFPAANVSLARSATIWPPAVSTNRSDREMSSWRSRYGGGLSRLPRNSWARCSSRLVTPATATFKFPESEARIRARPMAPHPTIPID